MKKIMEYGPARGAEQTDKPSATTRGDDGRLHNDNIAYDVTDKKVTANLASYNSQIYTNLAKKLEDIKQLSDDLAKLKDEVKQETRDHIADLFAAEDETRTRVVETVSFTMSLSAKPKATESYKYAEIVKALESDLTPELLTVLKALKEKFKTVTQKESSLKVELKEGIWDTIINGIRSFYSAITKWCSSYDKKLAKLKAEASLLQEEEELYGLIGESNENELPFPVGTTLFAGNKTGKLVGFAPNPEYVFLDSNGSQVTAAVADLRTEKPSLASRVGSWIVGESTATHKIGNDEYQVKGRVNGTALVKGMKVLGYEGTRMVPYEMIDAFDKNENVRYNSVKELMAAYDVKSLEALDGVTDAFLHMKDLEDGTDDDWFYIFKGRWSMGSGGSHMRFTALGEKINEAGEVKVVESKSGSFETTREVIAESLAANIYVVVVPHISDVTDSTPVMYVKGFNLCGDASLAASSVEQAVTDVGVDAIADLPSDKLLTVVTNDEGSDELDAKVWYQDGGWMTAKGPVKMYQVNEAPVYAHQEAHHNAQASFPSFNVESKWNSPKGKTFYVVSDRGGRAHLIDNKGSIRKDFDSIKTVEQMTSVMTRIGGKQIPLTQLSLVEQQVIAEVLASPEDAFPLVDTMDDQELESFKTRWDADKRYVDQDTETGRAYAEFGSELEAEFADRGL